jgi:hypothetical protein
LPAFLIGLAYAVTDEIHQAFVHGRHASPFDVSMDAAGLVLGLLVLHATRLTVQSQRGRAKNFDDRQLDAILERLDGLRAELQTLNQRLDHTRASSRSPTSCAR